MENEEHYEFGKGEGGKMVEGIHVKKRDLWLVAGGGTRCTCGARAGEINRKGASGGG